MKIRILAALTLTLTLTQPSFAQSGNPDDGKTNSFDGLVAKLVVKGPVYVTPDASAYSVGSQRNQKPMGVWDTRENGTVADQHQLNRAGSTVSNRLHPQSGVIGVWPSPVPGNGGPPAAVRMTLELTNTNDTPIEINDAPLSTTAFINIDVTGPLAVKHHRRGWCTTGIHRPAHTVVIQPGKTHRIAIKDLRVGFFSHWSFKKAGQYEVTVTFQNGYGRPFRAVRAKAMLEVRALHHRHVLAPGSN